MPGPAARMGDLTAHGGTIVLGFPTVLIAGQPAARLTDMHVCPMVTPGVPPIPHVGGPITGPGCPTVLIGNMPAVTMGDMCVCVGPPDVIVKGAPTVMIGMAGAGAASSGGGGGGGAGGAQASAAAAKFDNTEAVTEDEHWIEFACVDKAGLPVSGVPYKFKDSSGKVTTGVIRLDGRIRRSGIDEGNCELTLMSVYAAEWSKETAKTGDELTLKAKVEGFDNGTAAVIQIWQRDLHGPDILVEEISTTVSGSKVEGKWRYEKREEDKKVVVPKEGSRGGEQSVQNFSAPEFYFEVIVERCKARSGALYQSDFIEFKVTDEQDRALSGEEYIVFSSSGEVRRGKTDSSGKGKEEDVPTGYYSVQFPRLYEVEFKK